MKNSYFISFLLSCLLVSISSTVITACEFDRNWQRHDGPVLRSPIFNIPVINYGYEAAGDPHAFQTTDGAWRMIYSADDDDQISIKLAERRSNGKWQEGPVLLGPSTGHTKPRSKETSFYRLSPTGEHQIYFIGYDDEETYQSEVYLAVSEKLEGPYEIISEPVMPRGKIAEKDVYLITSPSVIDEDEKLTMTFLGWDEFEYVTEVWSFGTTSIDNGRSWSEVQEVKVPIGMEGQITKTPDGRFAAVRTGEYGDGEVNRPDFSGDYLV